MKLIKNNGGEKDPLGLYEKRQSHPQVVEYLTQHIELQIKLAWSFMAIASQQQSTHFTPSVNLSDLGTGSRAEFSELEKSMAVDS